jgi:hypothetical protein
MRRVRHKSLQIDFETGVGVYTGQGSDPQAMLRWSDDGGRTWSNTHTKTIGAIGNYKTRVKFDRLGVIARSRVRAERLRPDQARDRRREPRSGGLLA